MSFFLGQGIDERRPIVNIVRRVLHGVFENPNAGRVSRACRRTESSSMSCPTMRGMTQAACPGTMNRTADRLGRGLSQRAHGDHFDLMGARREWADFARSPAASVGPPEEPQGTFVLPRLRDMNIQDAAIGHFHRGLRSPQHEAVHAFADQLRVAGQTRSQKQNQRLWFRSSTT